MAVTLAQIKDRIRQRADKVNSTFIADAELTSYVNASYAELYDILVSSYEDYFITGPTTFTLSSSDSGVYALPSTFYKLKGIDFLSGGEYVTVYPFNWNSRNSRNRATQLSRQGDVERTYRLVGSNLRIEPDDNATGTYRIWYIPSYTALSAESDNIDSVITRSNWEEYIVLDAAIKILNKEESDSSSLVREKATILRRIETMAGQRDVDQPETISDVRSDLDDMRFARF